MPRADATFTGDDLVRLWARNLSPSEQKDVLVIFAVCIVVAHIEEIRSKTLRVILSLLARFAPRPWNFIIRAFLRLFRFRDVVQEATDFYERATTVSDRVGLSLSEISAIMLEIEDL